MTHRRNTGLAVADATNEARDFDQRKGRHEADISDTEEIYDPLDGLVKRIATDAGAAFAPDVLEQLARLKRDNCAAFEMRAKLKRAGCRVTALDKAIAEEHGEAGARGSQADILIELAQTAELFHTPHGTGFADLDSYVRDQGENAIRPKTESADCARSILSSRKVRAR